MAYAYLCTGLDEVGRYMDVGRGKRVSLVLVLHRQHIRLRNFPLYGVSGRYLEQKPAFLPVACRSTLTFAN